MSDENISVYSARESERAVIGAILNGIITYDAVDLKSNDFTDYLSREIYDRLGTLSARGSPTDMVTLIDTYNDELTANRVIEIATGTPIATEQMADGYIATIKSASTRRAMSKAAQHLATLSADPDADPMDSIEISHAELDDLMRNMPHDEIVPINQVTQRMHRILFGGEKETIIRTGLSPLDNLLGGGIRGSKLCIIGARPSVGKSALGLQIAHNAAADGKRVLLVSLEMDEVEIYCRMLSRYAMIDVGSIEQHNLSADDKVRITEAYQLFDSMHLSFATRANTPAQIRAQALKMRMDDGLDLIVVDYLQLLQSGKKAVNRSEEVGQISRDLKLLAMELSIPVIAMTQMNRNSEAFSASRMPRMSESRESGSIEQDANQYIILHAPSREEVAEMGMTAKNGMSMITVYENCRSKGMTYMLIQVAKNRNGKKGMFPVAFDAPHMRFLPFWE